MQKVVVYYENRCYIKYRTSTKGDKMQNIGLSDEIYNELLKIKNAFEKKTGGKKSFDQIVKELLEKKGK